MTETASSGVCRLDEKTHLYTIDGLPADGVTDVLKENGLINTDWYNERARSRGSAVHRACHLIDTVGLKWATLHQDLHGYAKSWEAFKAHTRCRIVAVEQIVHRKDLMLAGMLDRVLEFPGSKVLRLVDLKTTGSTSGRAPFWTRYQTACYAKCYDRGRDMARGAIVLRPDGSLPGFEEYEGLSDWPDFLTLLEATRIRRRHKLNGIESAA